MYNAKHKGIVLFEGKLGSWDSRGATWCYVSFIDDKIYLYYTGFGEKGIDKPLWSIGLATSKDGFRFDKQSHPVLEECPFCSFKAWTPVVFRVKNRFFMVFAGAPSGDSGGRLGIAWADDPKGPFKFIREILHPEYFWEGVGVDLGPAVFPLGEDDFLVYYSNHAIKRSEKLLNIIDLALRKGLKSISFNDTYRYVRRRIGIARIKISGTSKWDIKVFRYFGNPLLHLNGQWGSWSESLFCPGLLHVGGRYYLLPAASTYSIGFPYKQYVGLIKAKSPFFQKVLAKEILISGPSEKDKILPSAKSQLALDTPCALLMGDEQIFIYYSVMDRAEGVWRVALSIFKQSQFE